MSQTEKTKILVTGGAGYIGSHTVVELAAAGYTPVILDNFVNSDRRVLDRLTRIIGRPVQTWEGDCCDPTFVDQVFHDEGTIAGVIHFAALKAVGESMDRPVLYYRNNLDALLTVLEAMEVAGVTDLVFSSSACVYGETADLPVTEETPVQPPMSPYGATKKIGERIIQEAAAGQGQGMLRAVSLRYFNPIGAHPSALIGELPIGVPNNLVPYITQVAAGLLPELTVYGRDYATPDGTAIRDYIHVTDLAEAHVAALRFLETTGQPDEPLYDVFNLGTGRGNSVLEVIQTFEEVNHLKIRWRVGNRRPGDIEALYANADKAGRVLGWRATRSLADGLASAWAWQKQL